VVTSAGPLVPLFLCRIYSMVVFKENTKPMNPITIKINKEGFILKQSFRALLEFETRTGKSAFASSSNVTDSVMFFYCMLVASNPERFTMSHEEFLNQLDEDPSLFVKFNDYVLTMAGIETAKAEKKRTETR